MEKILTIVIPTYNMQDYLRRCLDSLIVPEEQMKQLEVLVVNDGSKDNSSAIAHEYQDKYPGIYRVIDKENGNYGSCVNRGLKEATGKYIKILDADDYYDTANLKLFIRRLNEIDADAILSCHSVYVNDIKKETIRFHKYNDGQIVSVEKELPSYFTMDNIAYKSQIFDDIDYKQTEGISYTDQEWIFYPMEKVKTLCYFDLDIYQYMTGHAGQTMEMKTYYGRISQVEIIVVRMLEYLISNQNLHPLKREYFNRVVKGQMDAIYRAELLINKTFNLDLLLKIEKLWKSYNPTIYTSFGGLLINKYFPIRYVYYWRKNNRRYGNYKRKILMDVSFVVEKIRRAARKLIGFK